jgi:hypothetical protein
MAERMETWAMVVVARKVDVMKALEVAVHPVKLKLMLKLMTTSHENTFKNALVLGDVVVVVVNDR